MINIDLPPSYCHLLHNQIIIAFENFNQYHLTFSFQNQFRFFSQRSSVTRRNVPDVPLKLANSLATSQVLSSSPTSHSSHHNNHPHYRNRRYSNNQSEPKESEDGWIAVGPKHHHNGGHNRKSFNHEDGHHRKRFNEFNRQSRHSFSKNQDENNSHRKKSFSSHQHSRPNKDDLNPTTSHNSDSSSSNSASATSGKHKTVEWAEDTPETASSLYNLADSQNTAKEYEAWKAKMSSEQDDKEKSTKPATQVATTAV